MRVELPPLVASITRGSGLAGGLAAIAGLAAVVSVTLPWSEVTAELSMLGVAEDRAVAAIAGWATIPGLVAGVAGLGAVGLGAALAVDRHPGWTRPGLLLAAAALALSGIAAQLLRPSLDRFPDAAGAVDDLRTVAGDLPRGVELVLAVRTGAGATLTLVAGLAVLVAAAAARDLDRR
ncbi:MAG: hypothetical protein WEB09_11320 [Nitriliruptor sp.]